MKFASTLAAACLMTATSALAQTSAPSTDSARPLSSIPANSATITNYYQQDVYDPTDNKIGNIKDVLVDSEGKITTMIVGVGGFLGVGDHNVAVPFSEVKGSLKNGRWYLTMDTTKDALKTAQGWKYDRTKTSWVPSADITTGSGSNNADQSNNH